MTPTLIMNAVINTNNNSLACGIKLFITPAKAVSEHLNAYRHRESVAIEKKLYLNVPVFTHQNSIR